jgi:hypothetical protein
MSSRRGRIGGNRLFLLRRSEVALGCAMKRLMSFVNPDVM